jgi:choline/glycine/proline betaine transport protein
VDALAVFATVFGLATTLGLGARQTGTGLKWLFSVEASLWVELSVVTVVTMIATISVVSGVRRGVKILSEMNLWLTLVLLAAFMVIGPFDYMAGLLVQEIGGYLDNLLVMTFYVGANEPGNWQSTWTVFFWGWWLAWSPFVGLFIARISRGRTLREFVFGVLLLPTLVTFVWIAVMGGLRSTANSLVAAGSLTRSTKTSPMHSLPPSSIWELLSHLNLSWVWSQPSSSASTL